MVTFEPWKNHRCVIYPKRISSSQEHAGYILAAHTANDAIRRAIGSTKKHPE